MYSITIGTYPHWVDFDAGKTKTMKGCVYTPRQDSANGRVKEYEIFVSNDGKNWGQPVAAGTFPQGSEAHKVLFDKAVKARYIRFKALSEQHGEAWATGAEFSIIE
jgi:beta-galactosidase